MIKHAAEIEALEALKFRVVVLGKGESNPSTMYRVRRGSRGRVSILDERELLELVERERVSAGRRARRSDAGMQVRGGGG